jgi:hypothetical protein
MKNPTYMKIGETSDLEVNCLNCGATLYKATSLNCDEKPHEGAITICSECGHIMGLDFKLNVRELTGQEIVDLAGNPEVIKAVKFSALLKLEMEMKRELRPAFSKFLNEVKLESRASDSKNLWYCRIQGKSDSEVGVGETESEAIEDLMDKVLKGMVNETYKRLKRGRST